MPYRCSQCKQTQYDNSGPTSHCCGAPQEWVPGSIWDGICCRLCDYQIRMGNRRTPTSRANWIRYCQQRHEGKHRKAGDIE